MRLDQWMVEQGFFDSREKCRREILAGRVYHLRSGEVLDKPGMKVPSSLELRIEEKPRFVSRAGDKFQSFLDRHPISLQGFVCLDIGSSTGGFTDCALQHGAAQVYAVDVGTHQLHEKLREDPRVHLYEQTDIRHFDFEKIKSPVDLVMIDVSFISVRAFIQEVFAKLNTALYLILFKPQFESGREGVGRKGIVDDQARKESLEKMREDLKNLGFKIEVVEDSGVLGMKGNQETFIMGRVKLS